MTATEPLIRVGSEPYAYPDSSSPGRQQAADYDCGDAEHPAGDADPNEALLHYLVLHGLLQSLRLPALWRHLDIHRAQLASCEQPLDTAFVT